MTITTPTGFVGEMNDLYDALTIEVIERTCGPESRCVDIGAGTGELLEHMIRVAPLGRHIAVEPLPQFAAALRRDHGGVVVWQAAAAEAAGPSGFVHVTSNPGYSGLRRRPYDRPRETLDEIAVVTARLDDMVGPGVPVDLIKIDVEGGEVGVLRGASRLLREYRPVIVFEHGGDRVVREYGVTTDDLWRELAAHGYRVWTLPGFVDGGPALDRSGLELELSKHWYFVAAGAEAEPTRQGGRG